MINIRKCIGPTAAVLGLAFTGLFFSMTVQAVGVSCSSETTTNCVSKDNTGGLWNTFEYGDCFYMLPTATLREMEMPIGPGASETATSAETCIGGDLTTVPDIAVRVSRSESPEESLRIHPSGYDGRVEPIAAPTSYFSCVNNLSDSSVGEVNMPTRASFPSRLVIAGI